AVYARFSTRFQHSIEDQIRECLKRAAAYGLDVHEDHIFFDRGKSGQNQKRLGLQRLITAIDNDEVDVVITFSTSRLYRKMYEALRFIDTKVVAKRKRAIFVAQNIDTDKTEFWKQLVYVFAMMDELQVQVQGQFVRTAHQGLLLKHLVHGTISYGYT